MAARLLRLTSYPPTPSEMSEALDALEKYLHAEDEENSSLVRLALIHYQFEAIHPFLDGNGRIGRLLIPLLMASWGLLPSPLLYLSAYFERHRDRYYNLLLAVSEHGAWSEWILFFFQGVAEQARDAASRAKRFEDLRLEWGTKLTRARASSLLLALADKLFEQPVITIPLATRLLGVTYRSAQQNIEKLVTAGVLRQLGDTSRGRTYVASEILEIVSDRA